MNFTHDELNLMMLYSPGDKSGLVKALKQMKEQLTPEETELTALVDSTLVKLNDLTDADFDKLNLYPDF